MPSHVDPPRSDEERINYRFKTVRAVRGTEPGTIAKWEKLGWTFVQRRPGSVIQSELRFRRERRGWFTSLDSQERSVALSAGFLGLIVLLGLIGASVSLGGGDEPHADAVPTPSSPTQATMEASTEPSAEGAAVVSFIEGFLKERREAGVMLARAVSSVEVIDRVLKVTFDPGVVQMSRPQFDSVNPYDNPYDESESLADFIGTPLMGTDEVQIRLRGQLDRIVTSYADGDQNGERTIEVLEKLNGID